MNSKQNNFFLILSFSIVLILTACSGGGNSEIRPDDSFNIRVITGDWFFSPNCEEYVLGTDTLYLADQLPDTISIFSDSVNTLFIDAGTNNLVASVDSLGSFTIPFQSFQAYLDLGFISDTATVFLTGTGNFSSRYEGTMNLTFSEPLLNANIAVSYTHLRAHET